MHSNADVPRHLLRFGLTLESLFPAIGIAFATSSRLLSEYRPLATPWALAFFPLILMSVLRLRPWLCFFSGIVSTLGYLAAAYYVGWHFIAGLGGYTVTQTAVAYFSLLLLASGVLAAGVAKEIRTHVEAALREVETRALFKDLVI